MPPQKRKMPVGFLLPNSAFAGCDQNRRPLTLPAVIRQAWEDGRRGCLVMHAPHVDVTGWIGAWGYLGVFIFVFIGNLGFPVPEETVLLIAGFMAGRGELDLGLLYAVGTASAVTGDCCGYTFGRMQGQRLFESLAGRFHFIRVRYERLRRFFIAHGNKAVFMARFVAGARFLAGPMAGAAGMPFLRFLGWNIFGAVVWCPLVTTIGYLVGDEVWRAAGMIHSGARWIALSIGVAALTVYLVRWWMHQAHTES